MGGDDVFESITATGVIGTATDFAGEVEGVILLVLGFGAFLLLANWVVGKMRSRSGGVAGKKSAGRKRRKRRTTRRQA